jgi:hypothetical protein
VAPLRRTLQLAGGLGATMAIVVVVVVVVVVSSGSGSSSRPRAADDTAGLILAVQSGDAASATTPSTTAATTTTRAGGAPTAGASGAMPSRIAAIINGNLVVLDSADGHVVRTLATGLTPPTGEFQASLSASSKGQISGPRVTVETDFMPHPSGVDLMCPYFEVARTLAKADTAAMACPGLPAGETITKRTDTVVRFENTLPNGNRVLGAARLKMLSGPNDPPGNYSVELITCELPSAQAKLCSTIIDTYLAITQPQGGLTVYGFEHVVSAIASA